MKTTFFTVLLLSTAVFAGTPIKPLCQGTTVNKDLQGNYENGNAVKIQVTENKFKYVDYGIEMPAFSCQFQGYELLTLDSRKMDVNGTEYSITIVRPSSKYQDMVEQATLDQFAAALAAGKTTIDKLIQSKQLSFDLLRKI